MDYKHIDSAETPFGKAEVLGYPDLAGSNDTGVAERLFFLRQAGVTPKTVRITLKNGKARLEPGALYHMQGNLQMKTGTNDGIGRALFRKAFAGETVFINEIHGTGTILLEPSWGHYILLELNDDDFVMDDSMFYAAIGDVEVSAHVNRNVFAGAFGGEGFVQARIRGRGLAVLNSPVPFSELEVYDLSDGKLSVDGHFALIRDHDVEFRVEKSSKSWIGSAVSGEGMLQTFSGTGRVFVAPTLAIYQGLKPPVPVQLGGARADRTG